MSLICGLSGEVPESPTISPISGGVFERRLIEKYIEEYGTDPSNGQPLGKDQLIDVKAPPFVKPKVPSAAGIPGVLRALQDEWDAVMLYNHSLKQQLQSTRQELSHALYQHDAACRVIARLQKELSAAREALATLKPQVVISNGVGPGGDTDANVPVGMTDAVLSKVQEKNAVLTKERKQRGKNAPEGLAAAEQITAYTVTKSVPSLHSASTPGITCLDYDHKTEKVATGGNDKMIVIHDRQTEKVLATCKGHAGRINRITFVPDSELLLSASQDCTFRAWNSSTGASHHVFRVHKGPVTAINVHPTSEYVLTASLDTTWAFSDINQGRVYRVEADPDGLGLTAAQFHPDGIILGAGTAGGVIRVWDIREGNVANFLDHTAGVTGMSFSENGYHLVTAAKDHTIQIWDLRKLKTIRTITFAPDYEINDVVVDYSAQYLAVAGADLRVYRCKEWSEFATFADHTGPVTSVRFGPNAGFLLTSSMDRTVKTFGSA